MSGTRATRDAYCKSEVASHACWLQPSRTEKDMSPQARLRALWTAHALVLDVNEFGRKIPRRG